MKIHDFMKERGITKYQLSKQCNIPWATVADIFSGKTSIENVSAGTLRKIAQYLDVSMESLFDEPLVKEPDDMS